MKKLKRITTLLLALVMAASLAVSAYAATVVVKYKVYVYTSQLTFKATSLTTYTFVDTLSKGIAYAKNDVVIEFFEDTACTEKITTGDEDSGKFAATYDDTANIMTISMSGLAELNEATTVYSGSVKRGCQC